ncbi:uncharacterized protein JCM15063_004933 [Sporobolomyces koalae]|uniref:uncharacterized protein n=1 Tax=Sporobolomyces koalae TaxID=500713 RepID=UPI003180A028
MATRQEIVEQIEVATRGFDALLNNDVKQAEEILSANPESPFSRLGLGTAKFLAAALSREDDELQSAVDTLAEAEALATAELNAKRSIPSIYPLDISYKLLCADCTIASALISILSETYSGFISGLWKMKKAHGGFTEVERAVFPDKFDSSDSLETIFTRLNNFYVARKADPTYQYPTTSSFGSSLLPWRRRKEKPLQHSSSNPTLPTLSSLREQGAQSSASAPQSPNTSVPGSAQASVESLVTATETLQLHPKPLWEEDVIATMTIGGATLGAGLFGLITSMMPPKARKLMSWVGFGGTDREGALKLLTVSAAAGADVHSAFAALTLLTWYGLILLLSGWQANEKYMFDHCASMLDRVVSRFPNGTLWQLNRAKLARYQRRPDEAIDIIETALANGSSFREADSLLVFELSWLYLSKANYLKTADNFERMCTMNKWSLATYVAIAAGSLIEEINVRGAKPELVERVDALLVRLPTHFEQKRIFGEPPVTELFIARRLEAHKAKRERWIQAGRLSKDSKVWEVIKLTNAMELGIFWSTTGGRSPPEAVRQQIDHLSSFTPAPKYSPSNPAYSGRTPTISNSASTNTKIEFDTKNDLDSIDEIAIRDLLLGTLYLSLGDVESYEIAESYFQENIKNSGSIVDERWTIAFSLFQRAVVTLKRGDLEEKQRPVSDRRALWKPILSEAEKHLDGIATIAEFDFKNRLESRVLMLKNEITSKRKQVGL